MDISDRAWRSSRPRASLIEGRRDWYRIENKAQAADVYIYDEIGYFGITAADFVRELQSLEVREINLHLNTPGGDVFDGIAIHNALRSHSATVNVIVDSLAASIGSVIAMAGDRVSIMGNARMMIHEAFALAIGNAADMRRLASRLDETSNIIAGIYAERSGKPAADWRAAMEAETWYTGQQAVDAGLADEAISASGKQAASFDLSIFRNAVPGDDEEAEEVAPPTEEPQDPESEEPGEESADPLADLRAEFAQRETEAINPELEVALDRVLAPAH